MIKRRYIEYTKDKDITDTDTINEYNYIAENFVLDLKKLFKMMFGINNWFSVKR